MLNREDQKNLLIQVLAAILATAILTFIAFLFSGGIKSLNTFIIWLLKTTSVYNLFLVLFFAILIFLIINKFLSRNKVKLSDEEISDSVDLFIRSNGEQIHFSLDIGSMPNLRIWLVVINKSDKEIILDKIQWELFIEQFVKKEVTLLTNKLNARQTKNNILLELTLNSAEVSLLRGINSIGPKGCFYGKLHFVYNGKTYAKPFNLQEINYLIDKKTFLEPELKLSKEQEWALQTLLEQKNRTIERDTLLNVYKSQLKKNTASFNVLEAGLKKLKFIDIIHQYGTGEECWILTTLGIEIVSKH